MYNEQTGYEKDETLRQQDTNCGWGSTQSDLTTFRSFPRYQPDLHADGMFERDILIKKMHAQLTLCLTLKSRNTRSVNVRPSTGLPNTLGSNFFLLVFLRALSSRECRPSVRRVGERCGERRAQEVA